MDDELIEKVARAIYLTQGYCYLDDARMFEPFPWEEADDCVKEGHKNDARAAIQAVKEAGWVHPSEIMVTVTGGGGDSDGNIFSSEVSTFPLFPPKA